MLEDWASSLVRRPNWKPLEADNKNIENQLIGTASSLGLSETMEGEKPGKEEKEKENGNEKEKEVMDFEGPANLHELVSSDDEIDYSVEPEFYDPKLDDMDELWVNKQRKSQSSDAVLSCPACFTTLCLDSQRHEKYVTQYRAMFVRNCIVRTDQILRESKQQKKPKRKRKSNTGSDSGLSEPKEHADGPTYRPVCCSVCSTEVGVLDEEEVYHFFNVIPSNS